jgi:hypothetical protein
MPNQSKSLKQELASRILNDQDTGKEKERKNLISVLKRLGLSSYEVTPGESPDFMVTFNNGDKQSLLACELTNFYGDRRGRKRRSRERRFFSKWQKIALKLRKELDERGLIYTYGALSFAKPTPYVLDSIKDDLLVEELVNISKSHAGKAVLISFPIQDYPILNSLLVTLSLREYPETGILWWCSHIQSGVVPNAKKAIIDIVAQKLALTHSYNWRDASEKWLLIVAEAKGLNDIAIIDDPHIPEEFPHMDFTRIILWERFQDELVQLFPSFVERYDSSLLRRDSEQYPQALIPFVA